MAHAPARAAAGRRLVRILHVGYGFRPWRHGGLIAYAEDVMDAQVALGHDVAYFCRGRHYPGLPNDRLRRWSRRGVEMREILNSTLAFGGDNGTLTPEDDLDHGPSERLFARTLDELRPDVVHVQELIGLPSAVLDIAHAHAIPVTMTLQDYLPLCPVLKLYDVDEQICLRRDVGEQCARCSATAPPGRYAFMNATAAFELRRVLPQPYGDRAVAGLARAGLVVRRLAPRRAEPGSGPPQDDPAPPRERAPSALRYQARRDVNVERLSRVDALVAQSNRLAEIYASLGVDRERLRVMQFTLRHLAAITPKTIPANLQPVRFATLNGGASRQKGAEVLLEAVRLLEERGLGARYVLSVLGYVPDETRAEFGRHASVEVGGGYAPGEIDRVLEPYHVGIVPSVWEEAYGYVGPEFIAKGIPVIGNARGGIVDYTRNGETGWVNRSADGAGLAAIMAELIERPEQIADRNRWILEHRDSEIITLDSHVTELDALYGELVGAAQRRESELAAVAPDPRAGQGRR